MIFVSPHFPGAHPRLPWPRLYPFPQSPHAPPPSGFILLDSGAFGLSQRGQSMDINHIHRLAAHYRQHASPIITHSSVSPSPPQTNPEIHPILT